MVLQVEVPQVSVNDCTMASDHISSLSFQHDATNTCTPPSDPPRRSPRRSRPPTSQLGCGSPSISKPYQLELGLPVQELSLQALSQM
jgi:hypothetical protein